MQKLQPVKGTNDIFDQEYLLFEHIIKIGKEIAKSFGYRGITLPIFEFTEVFKRGMGETSDVVGKEMYSFTDQGGDNLSLRPEFTASICRAYISNGFKQLLPLKLFTYGPLFRRENPQHGRRRQFNQLDYEYFGKASPFVDAEIISMAVDLLEKIGVLEDTSLELNSLGCLESRKKYQTALVEYFKSYENELSNDSKVRLYKNPLRILDSKDLNDRKLLENVPKISDFYTNEAQDYFSRLLEILDTYKIKYNHNVRLVRGLDYYNHTAFEFVSSKLGAQGTVLGGGRFNGLVKLLGGEDVEAIGFAAGIERLALLCKTRPELKRATAVIALSANEEAYAASIANSLRKKGAIIHFDYDCKFDKALKNAVKANCRFAVFIGENEIKMNKVKIKDLDARSEELIEIEEIFNRVK